jgi:iron complex transport system ATP-binding protein
MNPNAPLLELRGADVLRGGRRVLCGVDLRIESGENVAFLGPNGSGKSSLLKVLTRETYPDAELCRIWGRDDWPVSELRFLLGIVTQDLQDFCKQEITARATVLSGFFSSVGLADHHVVTPAMEKKADELLDFLEVRHLAGEVLTEISHGEARRVLIARALVHDPRALVLDEPDNSLDLHAQFHFRRILRKIAGAGRSVVLATHDLGDIIPEVSRVVLLKGGRVFADGPKEEVLSEKNLESVFEVPVRLDRKDGFYQALR